MCGIAGIIGESQAPGDRRVAVARMCARMEHRGPDDAGMACLEGATLGMRRLAVFDPANGRQPMESPDGRYTIVFNGAIYNHRDLASELEVYGWNFRTQCDTEVLLAAFAQWGPSCMRRLRGMYAFAVWDRENRSLFLARGPFGIKPLYYHWRTDGSLFFASELRALLASRGFATEIEPTAVGAYLAHLSVPAPETIYRRVRCLLPGQCAEWRAGQFTVRSHYALGTPGPGDRPCASYPEFVAQLRAKLEDSVQAHSVADVPVGAFLSGGLDSSAIVAMLARGGPRLKTFTLVFDEAEYSERDAARRTSSLFGTEHHELLLRGSHVAESLPSILDRLDQPTGDGINTYFVSRLAAGAGVKVVLSGLGGDEIFGGYPSFVQVPAIARALPYWLATPKTVRSYALRLLRMRPSVRARKLTDFLTHARDLHEIASLQRMVFSESARLQLLEPGTRSAVERLGPFHPMLNDFAFEFQGVGTLRAVSAWEMRTYMTDVLLADADVFSMANSIELRTPFIDSHLVGWLWTQREDYVFPRGRYKGALSDATRDLLPEAVRGREKVGFMLPFPEWMAGPLHPFLEHTFSSESLASCPWLDARNVQSLWAGYQRSYDTRNWSRVWSLAVLIAFVNSRGRP